MNENIAKNINAMTRNCVINHPNCMNCEVFGMRVTRKSEETFAGIPTMGGMGVMDEDDEVEVEYFFKGNGFALPAEQFSPSAINDRNEASLGPDQFYFLIMPEAQTGEEDFFTISTHDLVFLVLGDPNAEEIAPRLAFEIVGRETITNIPPFNVRYVCNRRDDLHIKKGGELLQPLD